VVLVVPGASLAQVTWGWTSLSKAQNSSNSPALTPSRNAWNSSGVSLTTTRGLMLLRSKIMLSLRATSAHSLDAQKVDRRHAALIGRNSYSFIPGFLADGVRWRLATSTPETFIGQRQRVAFKAILGKSVTRRGVNLTKPVSSLASAIPAR
jgi:hypothetical protein